MHWLIQIDDLWNKNMFVDNQDIINHLIQNEINCECYIGIMAKGAKLYIAYMTWSYAFSCVILEDIRLCLKAMRYVGVS